MSAPVKAPASPAPAAQQQPQLPSDIEVALRAALPWPPVPPAPRVKVATRFLPTAMSHVQVYSDYAVKLLVTRHCKDVDREMECAVVPMDPVSNLGTPGSPGPFAGMVSANAYADDNWLLSPVDASATKSLTALAVKLARGRAAAAVAGFAFEIPPGYTASELPVARIDVYEDVKGERPVATLYADMAVSPMDYPLAYVMLPPERIYVVPPDSEVRIDVTLDGRASGTLQFKLVVLPPVLLVSAKQKKYY
jgi:hypothetical protein